MDKKDYLNTLKSIDLRPDRVKIKEHDPSILMEQANDGMVDVHNEIIKWFMKNPNPPDSDVHAFAEKMGIEPDKFEGHIYMILSSILTEGKSKDFKGKYDPKQLAKGIEVEKEHTPNALIAEKISKDHLAEIPDYYSRLAKMEKSAGVEEQKLNELFVQAGEIKSMPPGLERDKQILRIGMIAELDAVNFYDQLAELASDERVAKLMLDISHEEKIHAGEFESLLEEIDPEYENAEEEGESEVKDLLGI